MKYWSISEYRLWFPNQGCKMVLHDFRAYGNVVLLQSQCILLWMTVGQSMNIISVKFTHPSSTDHRHLWAFVAECILHSGTDEGIMNYFAPSLEECHKLEVFTQLQAIRHVASKIRRSRGVWGAPRRSRADEARDWLATTLLAHIPVPNWNYHSKVTL